MLMIIKLSFAPIFLCTEVYYFCICLLFLKILNIVKINDL